ncbi:MAG: TerB family tellurite resistance protein [Myxococcales bacterium]|nr:TerB family tellurite resistance protein [Myxococcales bacterium]
MGGRPQFELLADCTHCRFGGAVVEVYDPVDPASVFGLAAESRCRLCGQRARGVVRPGPETAPERVKYRGNGQCPACQHPLGDDELEAHACGHCGSRAVREVTQAGAVFDTAGALGDALARFAREEQYLSVEAFIKDSFEGLDFEALWAKTQAGEPIATGFDALFALFHRGGRAGGGVGAGLRGSTRPPVGAPPTRSYDPRAMVLALVSVLVADGKEDARELAFLDRFLAAESMAPLSSAEKKVHRPMELVSKIPPERREKLVEAMTQLACIDGVVDPSEMRLVASYASAWGIDPAQIDAWVELYKVQYASDVQRFFRRLRAFFLAPNPDPISR